MFALLLLGLLVLAGCKGYTTTASNIAQTRGDIELRRVLRFGRRTAAWFRVAPRWGRRTGPTFCRRHPTGPVKDPIPNVRASQSVSRSWLRASSTNIRCAEMLGPRAELACVGPNRQPSNYEQLYTPRLRRLERDRSRPHSGEYLQSPRRRIPRSTCRAVTATCFVRAGGCAHWSYPNGGHLERHACLPRPAVQRRREPRPLRRRHPVQRSVRQRQSIVPGDSIVLRDDGDLVVYPNGGGKAVSGDEHI